jgi:hypothetical protein
MLPPGLLPDTPTPQRSPLPWILGILAFSAFVGLFTMQRQLGRLAEERDELKRELASRKHAAASAAPAASEPTKAEAPSSSGPAPAIPAVAGEPKKAPDLKVSGERPRDPGPERLQLGLHDFRSARYAQAELQFFRAVPDSYLYLALSGLARADWREALGFLSRAMNADPQWLSKVHPRDLFGSEEEYQRVLKATEGRSGENPLDGEAKVLLAYLRYHDQGAAYAKALLLEVLNVQPEHPEAKRFLEAIEGNP